MSKRWTSADIERLRPGTLTPAQAAKPAKRVVTTQYTEDDLQRACIRFFAIKYPHLWKAKRLFHVANGGSRNKIEAAKLKAMGVVPGVCDLLLLIPRGRYGAAFFELKVGRNTLSEHQQAFIEEMKSDYYCVVIRSLADFEREVGEYLNNNH